MKAVNDRILVQKGIIPERTIGGIIISANTSTDAKVKLNVGKVLSVGEGLRFSDGSSIALKVVPGDIIMWEQFGDITAEVLGEGIVCVRMEDVTCILDKAEEYDGWFFDKMAYDEYLEKMNAELDKKKAELKELEATRKTKMKVRCHNEKCKNRLRADVYEGEEKQCGDCGEIMAPEKEDSKVLHVYQR
jgi:co-chaperonin GroES (HSP10)